MSWPLILAGVLSCAGALIHGVIGDGIVRPAALGDLPATRFGEGGTSRFLIRVAWHFTTIAFATFGIGLVIVGLMPGHAAALGVAYLGGALLSAWQRSVSWRPSCVVEREAGYLIRRRSC